MNLPNAQSNERPVLVTGATGYIGGRLVPRLLETGVRVRCLARDASRLQGRPWRGDVELVVGDVLRPESLVDAMRGVAVTYYLVHSLGAGSDFPERDVMAARNFGAAAKSAGVERIIYLGGLAIPGRRFRRILVPGMRRATRCGKAACRSPSFAPGSSWVRGVCPSK